MATQTDTLSRRALLGGAGALVVGFSLGRYLRPAPAAARGVQVPSAVQSQLKGAPSLDAWLRVDRDGMVTVFTGKVELGTGTRTALAQIVAEELDVPFERVQLVMGETDRVPEQGPTASSDTVSKGGAALRAAAAEARRALLELASQRFGVPAEELVVREGTIFVRHQPDRRLTYGELIGDGRFQRNVTGLAPTKSPRDYRIVGRPVPRVDLPQKLTGAEGDYLVNLRLPGMLHARILRAPSFGARIEALDDREVRAMPGVVAVLPFSYPGHPRLTGLHRVAPGDFVAVVAEREEQAIRAVQRLRETVRWREEATLPSVDQIYDWIRQAEAKEVPVRSDRLVDEQMELAGDRVVEATYFTPYQSHAPIGPSCSVARVEGDSATVWSSTQNPFLVRQMVARALGFKPEQVHVKAMDGSGVYGRGLDPDVDVEAAVIAQAVGRPVRLQWMRDEEFTWSPMRAPHVMRLRGALDRSGSVVALDSEVWYPVRNNYPGGPERNANPIYGFGNVRLVLRPVPSPIRTGYLRGVHRVPNTFALESFVDELAAAAGADPVEFRLRHLADSRARAVILAAADRVGWRPHAGPSGRGQGIAFALYDDDGASSYVAVVADVEVDKSSGQVRVKRLVVAHDCGLIINPDGLRNQIEGGAIQSTSWTLKERVSFDRYRITSVDWSRYPILTFPEVPDVDIVLINRPEFAPRGAGEPMVVAVPAAIANAVFDGTGARVRELPLTPERVRAALQTA